MGSNRLEVLLAANAKPLNDALKDVDREVNRTMGSIRRQAAEAAAALAGLAAGGTILTKTFLDKASEMQGFEATLKAMTGSTATARAELKKLADFASSTPFELPGVVDAGIRMRALGVDTDRFLPLAGTLASAFRKDLPEAAATFAKGLKGIPEGLTSITENFGITKEQMVQFGARLDSAGAIAAKTPADLEKLQVALEKVVKTKFGDAMGEQSKTLKGAFSNLSDAVGQLGAELGTQLAPSFTSLAKSLTGVVDGFRALPEETKGVIAQAVLVGTAAFGASAAMLGLAAALGPAALAYQAYAARAATAAVATGAVQSAALGTTAIFAGLAGAVGLLAGVIGAAYIHSMGEANRVAAEQFATHDRMTRSYQQARPVILAVAEAYQHYGKTVQGVTAAIEQVRAAHQTDVDVTKAILGLTEAANRARAEMNFRKAGEIEREITMLREVRTALAGTAQAAVDAEKAKIDAAKVGQAEAQRIAEDFKQRASKGVFVDAAEELAQMDLAIAGLRRFAGTNIELQKQLKELELERVKLARQEDQRLGKERLERSQHEIEVQKVLSNDNKVVELQGKQEILKNLESYHLSRTDKIKAQAQLELDILKLQKEVQQDYFDFLKTGIDGALQGYSDLVAHMSQEHAGRIAILEATRRDKDLSIEVLRDKLKAGENVVEQLNAELTARAKLLGQIAKEKGEKESIGKTEAEAAQFRKAATQEATNATMQGQREVEQNRREAVQKARQDASADADLTNKYDKARVDALRKVYETTGEGKGAYIAALKEQQAAEEAAMRAKADAESVGKNEVEQTRISRQLNLDLTMMHQRQREEIEKANAELKKANDETRKLKGEMTGESYGVEEFFKRQNEDFGLSGPAKKSRFETDQVDEKAASNARRNAAELEQLNQLGPTERAEAKAGLESASKAGADVGEASGGALLTVMQQVLSVLQSIAAKPTTVDWRGNRPQTEDTPWQYRTHRAIS